MSLSVAFTVSISVPGLIVSKIVRVYTTLVGQVGPKRLRLMLTVTTAVADFRLVLNESPSLARTRILYGENRYSLKCQWQLTKKFCEMV